MKKGIIVTGDLSGELSVSGVVRELKKHGVSFTGTGGEILREEGVEIMEDMREITTIGLAGLRGKKMKKLFRLRREILRRIKGGEADFLLLVDYPGFNIPLGMAARRYGIPIFYFIPPTVWAWRERRARTVSEFSTAIFTIYTFEHPYFEAYGGNVLYAGNPLVWRVKRFLKENPPSDEEDRILFLPGSREEEVRMHLPPMLSAISILREKGLKMKFAFLRANTVDKKVFPPEKEPVDGEPLREICRSKMVVAKSGTGVMEAFLLKKPVVAIYRTSFLTYWIARAVLRVNYLSIPNIFFGREVIPELIQRKCTGPAIAEAVLKVMDEKKAGEHPAEIYMRALDTDVPPEEFVSGKIMEFLR